MKLWILVLVVCVIVVIYAVPTFYEAGIEKKIIKVARTMTKDLIEVRFLCLSSAKEYKVTFITGDHQGYGIYEGDKLLRTVYLDQIEAGVVYSSLLKDKEIIFKPVRDVNVPDDYYSVFLNDPTKESKKDMNSIIQIYINKSSYEIKLFRRDGVQDNGDLVFKEI